MTSVPESNHLNQTTPTQLSAKKRVGSFFSGAVDLISQKSTIQSSEFLVLLKELKEKRKANQKKQDHPPVSIIQENVQSNQVDSREQKESPPKTEIIPIERKQDDHQPKPVNHKIATIQTFQQTPSVVINKASNQFSQFLNQVQKKSQDRKDQQNNIKKSDKLEKIENSPRKEEQTVNNSITNKEIKMEEKNKILETIAQQPSEQKQKIDKSESNVQKVTDFFKDSPSSITQKASSSFNDFKLKLKEKQQTIAAHKKSENKEDLLDEQSHQKHSESNENSHHQLVNHLKEDQSQQLHKSEQKTIHTKDSEIDQNQNKKQVTKQESGDVALLKDDPKSEHNNKRGSVKRSISPNNSQDHYISKAQPNKMEENQTNSSKLSGNAYNEGEYNQQEGNNFSHSDEDYLGNQEDEENQHDHYEVQDRGDQDHYDENQNIEDEQNFIEDDEDREEDVEIQIQPEMLLRQTNNQKEEPFVYQSNERRLRDANQSPHREVSEVIHESPNQSSASKANQLREAARKKRELEMQLLAINQELLNLGNPQETSPQVTYASRSVSKPKQQLQQQPDIQQQKQQLQSALRQQSNQQKQPAKSHVIPIREKNQVKTMIGISDDKVAKQGAVDLVRRMNMLRKQKEEQYLIRMNKNSEKFQEELQQMRDRNGDDIIQKVYSKKNVVITRMQEYELKKIGGQRMQDASKKFIRQLVNYGPRAGQVSNKYQNEIQAVQKDTDVSIQRIKSGIKINTPFLNRKKNELSAARDIGFEKPQKNNYISPQHEAEELIYEDNGELQDDEYYERDFEEQHSSRIIMKSNSGSPVKRLIINRASMDLQQNPSQSNVYLKQGQQSMGGKISQNRYDPEQQVLTVPKERLKPINKEKIAHKREQQYQQQQQQQGYQQYQQLNSNQSSFDGSPKMMKSSNNSSNVQIQNNNINNTSFQRIQQNQHRKHRLFKPSYVDEELF